MVKINIVVADIADLGVDAIVCSAHKNFLPQRGLMAHIAKRAGDKFSQQCETIGKSQICETKILGGYDLPAKYVICTVTPRWSSGDQYGGECVSQLQTCYRRTLEIAIKHQVKSLAFAALGSGTHHMPQQIVSRQCFDSLNHLADQLDSITICLKEEAARGVWESEFNRYVADLKNISNSHSETL